jgi:hypothetical protein
MDVLLEYFLEAQCLKKFRRKSPRAVPVAARSFCRDELGAMQQFLA